MEFDWSNLPCELPAALSRLDVEESFEDPFAVKLMPDSSRFSVQNRFFNLGKANSGEGIVTVYRTNGKMLRVLCARVFEPEENFFYERKLNQTLSL